MTELDKALAIFRQDTDDPKNQSRFFDLFLNASFFVPTVPEDDPPAAVAGATVAEGQVLPLIIEAEGNDYLILFDTRERLYAWAEAEVKYVEVPGHVLAATSAAPLHWALNVGTEHSKQFLPEEIAWLKEVVERCNAEAAKEAEAKPNLSL
ncbi:MAG: hypothetical protein A2005_02800 [Desulfuromonadales bacterium GWC2_61_20]|nr:MAG: hypothetical protein A2005_02800 [Desulfuromonadales bacterium GWC2_61_20]HAD03809.1 hypothetical protein [Desulfuromonas sp.]